MKPVCAGARLVSNRSAWQANAGGMIKHLWDLPPQIRRHLGVFSRHNSRTGHRSERRLAAGLTRDQTRIVRNIRKNHAGRSSHTQSRSQTGAPDAGAAAPVECGGMTPLWNRETCLPVDRAALPTPPRACPAPLPLSLDIGRSTLVVGCFAAKSENRSPLPSRQNQGKNPSNQGLSRQIKPHQGIH